MKILGILLSVVLSSQVLASSSHTTPRPQSLTMNQVIDIRQGKVSPADRVDSDVVVKVLSNTPPTLPAQLDFAKEIALSILYNPIRTKHTLSGLVQAVYEGHSLSKHSSTSSYFYTDNAEQITDIIARIVNTPDSYIYQTNQCAIKLIKTFSQQDCQSLIGRDYIGHDRKGTGTETRRAVVCFGTKSKISKKENQQHWNGGSAMTAFPEH